MHDGGLGRAEIQEAPAQPVQVRVVCRAGECGGSCGAALPRGRGGDFPTGRRTLPLCSRLQPGAGLSGNRAAVDHCAGPRNGRRPRRHHPSGHPHRRPFERSHLQAKRKSRRSKAIDR
jgi:hypothetical protein